MNTLKFALSKIACKPVSRKVLEMGSHFTQLSARPCLCGSVFTESMTVWLDFIVFVCEMYLYVYVCVCMCA